VSGLVIASEYLGKINDFARENSRSAGDDIKKFSLRGKVE